MVILSSLVNVESKSIMFNVDHVWENTYAIKCSSGGFKRGVLGPGDPEPEF